MKPKRYWGITYRNSRDVMPDTIRRTRRAAQHACCDNHYKFREVSDDWKPEWIEWRKLGCRAVRVFVVVEDKP